MRPELLVPDKLTRDVVRDVLELVGVQVREADIAKWTKFELILAYDWAWRRHLAASDGLTRQRDKPSFVLAAQNERLKALGASAAAAAPELDRRHPQDLGRAVSDALEED